MEQITSLTIPTKLYEYCQRYKRAEWVYFMYHYYKITSMTIYDSNKRNIIAKNILKIFNRHYKKYENILEELGYISIAKSPGGIHKSYINNTRACEYTFNFNESEDVIHIFKNKAIIKKIIKYSNNEIETRIKLNETVKNIFNDLSIDESRAHTILDNIKFNNIEDIKIANSIESYINVNMYPVLMINQNSVYTKRDDYGRLHTPLTILKKTVRAICKIDDEYLCELDFSNMQPWILSQLHHDSFRATLNLSAYNVEKYAHLETIIQENRQLFETPDFLEFERLCLNGELWNYLSEYLQITKKKVKDRIQIFNYASISIQEREQMKKIAEIFPSLDKFLKLLKAYDYTDVAKIAQYCESYLCIDILLNDLYANEQKVLTVHDAFYCKISNSDVVENIILSKLKSLPINAPKLKKKLHN